MCKFIITRKLIEQINTCNYIYNEYKNQNLLSYFDLYDKILNNTEYYNNMHYSFIGENNYIKCKLVGKFVKYNTITNKIILPLFKDKYNSNLFIPQFLVPFIKHPMFHLDHAIYIKHDSDQFIYMKFGLNYINIPEIEFEIYEFMNEDKLYFEKKINKLKIHYENKISLLNDEINELRNINSKKNIYNYEDIKNKNLKLNNEFKNYWIMKIV